MLNLSKPQIESVNFLSKYLCSAQGQEFIWVIEDDMQLLYVFLLKEAYNYFWFYVLPYLWEKKLRDGWEKIERYIVFVRCSDKREYGARVDRRIRLMLVTFFVLILFQVFCCCCCSKTKLLCHFLFFNRSF